MSDDRRFAMITGASSGIGVAYAERLAKRGLNLILVARRQDRLEEIATRIRSESGCLVQIVVADLADAKDLARVEALLSARANIDVLVNNAGLGSLGPMARVSADALENLIKINVIALTRLSHAVLPGFTARDQGTIVNIASMIAVMPAPATAAYSGSKAYVMNFTRSLQMELAKTKIAIQAVFPGPVRTEFFEASGFKTAPFPDESFMSAEQLVDCALTALDRGELICFPSLEDVSNWTGFEESRVKLSQSLMKSGPPATRYSV